MARDFSIQEGDTVLVHWAGDQCLLKGTVRHIAMATGDCWIIESEDGRPHHFQTFEYIERCK